MRRIGGIMTVEKYSTWRKICSHPIPSTTNPIWTSLGFKPDIHTEKSANNHLSQDTIFYHQICPITAMKMIV
jgi:hypothetical protein